MVGDGVRSGVAGAQHRQALQVFASQVPSGWKPKLLLYVSAAPSLSECAVIGVASMSMSSQPGGMAAINRQADDDGHVAGPSSGNCATSRPIITGRVSLPPGVW
jgi:hypothetical protein